MGVVDGRLMAAQWSSDLTTFVNTVAKYCPGGKNDQRHSSSCDQNNFVPNFLLSLSFLSTNQHNESINILVESNLSDQLSLMTAPQFVHTSSRSEPHLYPFQHRPCLCAVLSKNQLGRHI